jgi:N-acetylmuramic acid 6-phosphate etherase
MSTLPDAKQKAAEFLRVAADFKLGALPTEQRHPDTLALSDLARSNLPEAFRILKAIDCHVVKAVDGKMLELSRLRLAIRETLDAGGRIFLYGCGATGRLSISVEHFWKLHHLGTPDADKVLGFMSGGDLALVHSIENFEDHPEWGARQLREIGFREGDLLISCTEGGETPSVIGCTEEALTLSSRSPFYLYCNPDALLREQVERSRRVLDNPRIEKISLFVGPMSLSGSTRLQASTALTLGVTWALLANAQGAATYDLSAFSRFLEAFDFSFLSEFVEEESRLYAEGKFLLYETEEFGITILTDTTERAPTFSLFGFENQNSADKRASLSYLALPATKNSLEAWRKILLREPISLEWEELKNFAGRDRLLGFDFSRQAIGQREALVGKENLSVFYIRQEGGDLVFTLNHHERRVDVSALPPSQVHLFLKLALNMHSTLVMGRIGRFESNVMTWVKPSNNKLIDRAIRYVEFLLEREGITRYSYEEITHQLFEETEGLWTGESIVLKTVAALKQKA